MTGNSIHIPAKTRPSFRKICEKAGRTIREHALIEKDDRVLIGLSGGKDSYVLLESLADRKRSLPYDFSLAAVHVIVKNLNYSADTAFMQLLCESREIPFYMLDIEPDFQRDPKKSACFVCSWHRRKAIFNLGKELNCNKLAFGHHRDDAIETFLLNLIYHGSISSLPYSLEMFNGRVKLIRPLLDIREKEIMEFAMAREYPVPDKSCPWDDQTKRAQTRKLIRSMEQLHPESSINIFHALDNIYPEYLPGPGNKKKLPDRI